MQDVSPKRKSSALSHAGYVFDSRDGVRPSTRNAQFQIQIATASGVGVALGVAALHQNDADVGCRAGGTGVVNVGAERRRGTGADARRTDHRQRWCNQDDPPPKKGRASIEECSEFHGCQLDILAHEQKALQALVDQIKTYASTRSRAALFFCSGRIHDVPVLSL